MGRPLCVAALYCDFTATHGFDWDLGLWNGELVPLGERCVTLPCIRRCTAVRLGAGLRNGGASLWDEMFLLLGLGIYSFAAWFWRFFVFFDPVGSCFSSFSIKVLCKRWFEGR